MKTILFLLTLLACSPLYAGNMIITLKDKKGSDYVAFSDRALARRAKNNVLMSYRDLAVSSDYISQLNTVGKVELTSRWLNAVTYSSNLNADELLSMFSFIESIDVYAAKPGDLSKLDFDVKKMDYGVAANQNAQIGADCLHNQGYTGNGVYLAILDAGFAGMDTISYFSSVYNENRLLDSYDFVNQSNVYAYSEHGTAVASCIVSEKPSVMVGTAFDVDLAIYVTEDVNSETPQEEFNLVAALEKCDVNGVDIANISLGYINFDNPADNHLYSDRDGNTTIAAEGVNSAAAVGIVVVCAAGNEGPEYISTPCDADSSLCVGAVNDQGNYAFFSSVGPNYNGQIKPDVAARGENAWVVIGDGSLVQSNGTSFASPIMCGATACLIDANPNMTAMQILDAVQRSGDQYLAPDQYKGYGIADLCMANQILGLENTEESQVGLFPNPSSSIVTISGISNVAEIRVVDGTGRTVLSKVNNGNSEIILDVSLLSKGVYTVVANGSTSLLFVD